MEETSSHASSLSIPTSRNKKYQNDAIQNKAKHKAKNDEFITA